MERILDISDAKADLRIWHRQLVVDIPEHGRKMTIPLWDLAVIIVSHPTVTFSKAVLDAIAENSGILIICGRNYMPVGIYTSIVGNCLLSQRLAVQVESKLPRRKRAWQQIVNAKILAQADVLQSVTGNDGGLKMVAKKVRSGDPNNLEGQAAQRYWKRLFQRKDFTRKPESEDVINTSLNYGYAILRSAMARAICAAGLHPAFGIHHKNKYNPFCLADDLMEPFRPKVDREIAESMEFYQSNGLVKETKKQLIEKLTTGYFIHEKQYTLFDAASLYIISFLRYLEGTEEKIEIVKLSPIR